MRRLIHPFCLALLVTLTPITLVAAQIFPSEPQNEAVEGADNIDLLDLSAGWWNWFSDGEQPVSAAKVAQFEQQLATLTPPLDEIQQATANAALANFRLLSVPPADVAVTDSGDIEVTRLAQLLDAVEKREGVRSALDAAKAESRLDKSLAADLDVRLNNVRDNYLRLDDETGKRATGLRWINFWSRQKLLERQSGRNAERLEVIERAMSNYARAVDTPMDQLVFDAQERDYWRERVEQTRVAAVGAGDTDSVATAPGAGSTAVGSMASEAALRDLVRESRQQVDMAAHAIAVDALWLTNRRMDPEGIADDQPDDTVTAIRSWLREAQPFVEDQRGRLLRRIEQLAVEPDAAGALETQIRLVRQLGENIQTVRTRELQLELLARLRGQQSGTRLGVAASDTWSNARRWLSDRSDLFNRTLFSINETAVTSLGLLRVLVIILVFWLASRLVGGALRRLQKRHNTSAAAAYAFNRVVYYLMILFGFLVAMSSIGIDLTKFALFASALGVGLGFGLQAVISNFVSGLIILFERSLTIGDFVELESGVTGMVREINVRGTLITTNDNIDILVPNSEFVNGRVTNWTLRDSDRRLRIPFGVAYGVDKDLVKKAALEAAESVPFTIMNNEARRSQVWLMAFGDSSLNFELVIWITGDAVARPSAVHAAYSWAIETALRKYGIEIPFPQRDLNVRSFFGVEGEDAIAAFKGQQRRVSTATHGTAAKVEVDEGADTASNDAALDALRGIEQHKRDKAAAEAQAQAKALAREGGDTPERGAQEDNGNPAG